MDTRLSRRFCILCLFLFCAFLSSSITSAQSLFVKAAGDTRDECGFSVIQTFDGGFVIAGTSAGIGWDQDLFLSKFDDSGNRLWTTLVERGSTAEEPSVVETSDHGFLVAAGSWVYMEQGDFGLSRFDSAGTHLWTSRLLWEMPSWCTGRLLTVTADGGFAFATTTYGWELELHKYNANGLREWTVLADLGSTGSPASLIQTHDGGYAIAGICEKLISRDYGLDIFISKFDPSGQLNWTTVLGGPLSEMPHSLVETPDRSLIILGSTASFGAGGYDILVSKFTPSGGHTWTKTIGEDRDDEGLSLIRTSDGGLAIAGSTWSYGAGGSDLLLAKLDAAGNPLWTEVAGGVEREAAYNVIETKDDALMLTGYTESWGQGGTDLLLAKFGAGGEGCVGSLVNPIVMSQTPTAISVTRPSGYTGGDLWPSAPTVTNPSYSVTSVCELTGREETPGPQDARLIFQAKIANPISSFATVYLSLPEMANLTVFTYDVYGREVGRSQEFANLSPGNHLLQIPMPDLRSGVYLVTFEAAGIRKTVKVAKVR